MSIMLEDMKHTCHVRRFLGMKDNGRRPEYGPATPFPCQWQPGTRQVRNAEGKQVVGEGTLRTTARLGPGDLLWLPCSNPADFARSREPLNTFEHPDLETGAFDHTEAVL